MHPSHFQPRHASRVEPSWAEPHARSDWDDDWAEPEFFDFQNSYLDDSYFYYTGLDFHPLDWAERAVRHGERFIDRQSHEWAEATKQAAGSAASGLRDAANRVAEIPEKSTKELADSMKTIAVIGVVGVAGIVLISAVLK